MMPLCLTMWSVLESCEHGNLLSSAVMTAYVSLLTWQTMRNDAYGPPIHRHLSEDSASVVSVPVSLGVMGLALLFLSLTDGWTPSSHLLDYGSAESEGRTVNVDPVPFTWGSVDHQQRGSSGRGDMDLNESEVKWLEGQKRIVVWINCCFFLASAHLSMLLCAWDVKFRSISFPTASVTAFWVNQSGVWVMMLIYLITLYRGIAPVDADVAVSHHTSGGAHLREGNRGGGDTNDLGLMVEA
eukprot:GHVN01066095.1.p1 GENE.GHVN01066095.1~~GHVN01066095.1.p1  ORF type:complete len:241 (+),score=45.98 GHVN01066095.1:930-1652(+)